MSMKIGPRNRADTEEMAEASSSPRAKGPPKAFFDVEKPKLVISPIVPPLRLSARRFLELERTPREDAVHPGGFDSQVILEGFKNDSYVELVYELIQERKDILGTDPSKKTERELNQALRRYYTQDFRGETTILQLVVAEYRLAKHCHASSGRPMKTYCYKCRLKSEMSYLARVYKLNTQPKATKEWLNMSDADSENDDNKWDELYDERMKEWRALFAKKTRRRLPRSGTRRVASPESPPRVSTDLPVTHGPATSTPTTEADSEERTGDTVQEQLRAMSEQIKAMQELIQSSKKPRTGNP